MVDLLCTAMESRSAVREDVRCQAWSQHRRSIARQPPSPAAVTATVDLLYSTSRWNNLPLTSRRPRVPMTSWTGISKEMMNKDVHCISVLKRPASCALTIYMTRAHQFGSFFNDNILSCIVDFIKAVYGFLCVTSEMLTCITFWFQ